MKPKLCSIVVLSACFANPVSHAQSVYEPYALHTLAGTAPGSTDGTGSAARFNGPGGMALDSAGNLFVADGGNHTIRKVTPAGVVTTFAGLAGVPGTSDGTGGAARFNGPAYLAIDPANNLFVTDSGNNTIRKITPSGVVTTFAGQAGIAGHADGSAATATFFGPSGIVINNNTGTIYVSDAGNNTIRAISSSGTVSTLAGSPGLGGHVDGTGSAARFSVPVGLALDSSGNIYVADNVNSTIRTVTPAGVVNTLAGTPGQRGFVNGPANTARFSQPNGVAVDSSGNVFVADSNNSVIREIAGGVVTTFAGTGKPGSADGAANSALFDLPGGITVTPSGTFYIADSNNSTIRVISPSAVVSTLAGSPAAGNVDGTVSGARFDFPQGIALDASGNAYVADTNAATIRKITPAGVVTTLAGSPYGFGNADGTGSAATFAGVRLIASDSAGNIYVPNTLAHTIRKVTPSGVVTTIAGTAFTPGSADGTGSAALFKNPRGIAVDLSGVIYVVDSDNNTIRKITSGNVVTTLAGSPGKFGTADGFGSAARFAAPRGIGLDSNGNLYVADSDSGVIRKVTPAGMVTSFAGSPFNFGSADGTGAGAQFDQPIGVAVDSNNNVYVADTGSNILRKITPAGTTTTLAGLPFTSGTLDGIGSSVRFGSIRGVAVSAAGIVYVTDASNHVVKVSTPLTLIILPAQNALQISGGSTLNVPAVVAPDPLIGLPAPSTNGLPALPGGAIPNGAMLHQGVYQNQVTVNGGAVVHFGPGLYILKNGINVSASTIQGDGVTLFNQGTMTVSGGSMIKLTPPATGTYAGITVFQAREDTTEATISGGSESVLGGTFYFPNAQVTLSGGSNIKLGSLDVSRLSLTGGSSISQ